MSNNDDDLPFGLYERLVTAGLKARLLRFDSAIIRIVTEELDATEAHATLARHIANLAAGALRALPQEDRAAAQTELTNQIIRDGRRQSVARSYLYPVLARKNVTLLVNTQVDRLTFAGHRATGVEIGSATGPRRIQARHEVILSSGGINTPKLLMLSGIGDEARLHAHGIKTLVHAPEVGQNFQDHIHRL